MAFAAHDTAGPARLCLVALVALVAVASACGSAKTTSPKVTGSTSGSRGAGHAEGAISLTGARQVLASYTKGNNAALASMSTALEDKVDSGPLAVADRVIFRIAEASGGKSLASFQRPWSFSAPSYSIPLASGYPRYFVVTAGESGPGASSGRGVWLFEKSSATAAWMAVAYVELGKGERLPPLDRTLPAPLRNSAAGSRLGLQRISALASVTKDQLYLDFPPRYVPSASCPRMAVGAEKYYRLTGLFKTILAEEHSQCASFAASHLSLSFNWTTTTTPVVSLPTSNGGALSFLVLDRKVTESSLKGSTLSCPPKPDPCSVFLTSPTGQYSSITYDEQFMLLVDVTPPSSSLDLLGAGESTIAVSGFGSKG